MCEIILKAGLVLAGMVLVIVIYKIAVIVRNYKR